MALGRDSEALAQVERGLAEAEQTDSLKYVGWFRARRGELALRAGDATVAAADLDRAVAIARRICHPTLTWQAADLLARARLQLGDAAQAGAAARLAEDTVAAIAAAAPESSLPDSLRRWPRVQEMARASGRVGPRGTELTASAVPMVPGPDGTGGRARRAAGPGRR